METTVLAPQIPPIAIGLPFAGGFYAGCINMAGVLHAIIVAPKDGGESAPMAWGEQGTEVPGANSYFDGAANTTAMAEAGLPLAKWAQALDIAGHTDWYLPSRDELEVIYRALKPTTETNYTWRSGENPSAVPPGYPYTDQLPAQTSALAFQEGGEQAFEGECYWSSTQSSRNDAWGQYFVGGVQYGYVKSYEARARALRRFIP